MKKLLLLFTGMLMGLTPVAGEATTSNTDLDVTVTLKKRYHHAQPILFVERGIEFIIFPNGDFDFNTSSDTYGYDDMYYRTTNTRRGSMTSPGNLPRHNVYRPRGVQVIHDRYGNVRRVGNVFVNYDYYGRVKRIGSVYIRYIRNRLVQVGGLHLKYNRHGKLIKKYGRVNRQWSHNWNYNHFGWDNNNDWDDDDDYYYYRKNGKKIKKSKKYKRRKYDDN